jgi:hypothetical protein
VLTHDLFAEPIRHLAEEWRNSAERPQVKSEVLDHWDRLIEDYLERPDLPLLLRVSRGSRGEIVWHKSGRALVCTDNASANWSLSCALAGGMPTATAIHEELKAGRLPVGFALTRAERAVAHYKGTQRTKMDPPNLNTIGWKVGHVVDIGLNQPIPVETIEIERLCNHFRLFLHPRNMFVIPKVHAGLAESKSFSDAFRADPWFERLPSAELF